MKFKCPFCNIELESDAVPGDIGDCPNCGKTFPVPAPSEAAARKLNIPKNGALSVPKGTMQHIHDAEKQAAQALPRQVESGSTGAFWLALFFFPAGIVAVVLAGLADGAQMAGDRKEAIKYAVACSAVKSVGWVCFLVMLVCVLLGGFAGCAGHYSGYRF